MTIKQAGEKKNAVAATIYCDTCRWTNSFALTVPELGKSAEEITASHDGFFGEKHELTIFWLSLAEGKDK